MSIGLGMAFGGIILNEILFPKDFDALHALFRSDPFMMNISMVLMFIMFLGGIIAAIGGILAAASEGVDAEVSE